MALPYADDRAPGKTPASRSAHSLPVQRAHASSYHDKPDGIQNETQNVSSWNPDQGPRNPLGTRKAKREKSTAEDKTEKAVEKAALLEDGAVLENGSVLEKAALLEKVAGLGAQEKKHQKEKRRREEDETTALQAKIADLEAKRNAREETVGERERREKKDLQREAGERSLSAGFLSEEEE